MSKVLDIVVNGENFQVEVIYRSKEQVRFKIQEREYLVEFLSEVPHGGQVKSIKNQSSSKFKKIASIDGILQISTPIPGLVSKINITLGQKIAPGDLLVQIEAMKMQNNIFSEVAGEVSQIHIEKGDEVSVGQILVGIKQKWKS